MFLKSYLELRADFTDVCEAMLWSSQSWLQGLAVDAQHERKELLMQVGLLAPGPERQGVATAPRLTLGDPLVSERVVSIPIRIEIDPEGLWPSFDGSLDAAWLGERRTQLAFSAQYAWAVSDPEEVVDRALVHRVAESVAQDFLQRAAVRLAQRLDATRATDLTLPGIKA
ncbi:MAG: hypothetical protein J2P39_11710 [Candidatus Dormibacteraeota bacterium]|nr:hypothetical protein [Candidatus Dormibacteraeota bacterium]